MSEEEKKAIKNAKYHLTLVNKSGFCNVGETTLNVILNLIEKQDKMINKAIKEIETLRQYFDESSQGDFIRILEILKDKNVIDW